MDPRRYGGAQAFRSEAVDAAVQVTAVPAQLFELELENTTSAPAYLQIFFKPSASVTLGTTAPDFVVPIEANARLTRSFANGLGSRGGSGLTLAATTTPTGSTTATVKASAGFM